MMKNKVLTLLLLMVTLMLIFPINVSAETLTYGNVLDELEKAKKELENNNQSLGNTANQIQKDNEIIKKLKQEIEEMKEENTKLQEEIAQANIDIENKKQQTKDIITYLQMSQGENIYLEYVFGSDSITDMIYRLSIVEQITEYNDKMIKELEELITLNESKKVELIKNEKKSEEKIQNLTSEIEKLNQKVSSLSSLTPSLKDEVKTKEDLVSYYKSQGCSKRSDIIGVDCAKTTATAAFTRPIKNGYVTSFTGYRWIFGKYSFHKGIDIGSSTGSNTPIYSIGYGIISSLWTDTAGAICVNTLHKDIKGQNYTAVYCHLSKRASNLYVGMEVTPNTFLGYMGATGNVTGVHLHLEVYPCHLWGPGDKNCSTWSKYESYTKSLFDSGKYKGSESVINFPSRTYQTWYTR